jgi:hypothetical protein
MPFKMARLGLRRLYFGAGINMEKFCIDAETAWAFSLRNCTQLIYCGRDKSMPNGWSFDWESMATRERESLETHCVESMLGFSMCVCSCYL